MLPHNLTGGLRLELTPRYIHKSLCALAYRSTGEHLSDLLRAVAKLQELVKVQGIKCLAEEKNPALMNKLADCMSQVAAQTWMNEQERWTGLLQHMQQFISADDPHHLEVALVLFCKLTEWLDQDDLLQQQTGQMYNVLLRCLQNTSRQVQLAACKASISFITVRLRARAETSTLCAQ